MRRRLATGLLLTALGSLAGSVLGAVGSAAPAHAAGGTWYVRAGASTTAGTHAAPFGTLDQAEQASAAGDTIVVLAAAAPLDGGIVLKAGQTLRGEGGPVAGAGAVAPRLTNTTTALEGDAVRLADGATVANLRIEDARRGAVYGVDVTGVRVTGNEVTGQNTSCTKGFLIPRFSAPTNLPGAGIPIAGGLQNGWAGIMIDAPTRIGFTAVIEHNLVHDADCGDGIDVRAWGTASGTAWITDNTVRSLRQGKNFKSVLAIGLQARDQAHLVGRIDRNTQALLGEPADVDLVVHGADSEGVFLNASGPARLDAVVTENTYTNQHGWGGFSANGLEMVSMGAGARMSALVQDSSFSGAPGDLIEHGALGTDAHMTMTLDNVVVEDSTGIGNTYLLPFNNGDCVLAGSLGARNTVVLDVRRSVLRNCANNGLSLGSNVTNGRGPTTEIRARVTDSVITGNRGGNVGIRNFTELDRLSFFMERTDLRRSRSLGSSVADFAAEDFGRTGYGVIDIGGGSLGSSGSNCLLGGLLAADAIRYDVSARQNWWGTPYGPGPFRTLAIGGVLDTRSPLGATPARCVSDSSSFLG